MGTLRFVASLVMGLALVMGTVTVSTASADAEKALPRCKEFTTITADFAGAPVHTYKPTTGFQNRNTECKLQWGDEYPGVFVLQGVLSECLTKIKVDGKYYGETESAVRFIQGMTGIATDGVYGPDTRDVLGWPWYSASNKFLFCA